MPPLWQRSLAGRRLYKCDGPRCGASCEPWGGTWLWYGSYRDIEDDPYGFPTFCGFGCATAYAKRKNASATKPVVMPFPQEGLNDDG